MERCSDVEVTPLVQRLSRSPRAATVARIVRNQCNRVIGYHVGPSFDPAENGEHWLIDSLADRLETFVDAGANVGDWTASVLERAPSARGILAEPGRAAIDRLHERFDGQVRIVEAALGDRQDRLTFYEQPRAGEWSSFFNTAGEPHEVSVITLDSLGLERLDLLKIDVEGFEGRVLRGAERMLREQRIRTVQFEYNSTWIAAGETLAGVVAFLRECGYATFLLRPDRLAPLRRWGEFFAYSNFVARPID